MKLRKKIKKFFSIAAPPSTCAKGGGGTSQKVGGIYSEVKYPDFALCVRTQINVYITGCIVTPPNNKTRLKRLICVHNGHYARKQGGTRLKMYIYAII